MAGGQERILRRRIKSIQSTKKITRAMELIAASRIVQGAGARSQAAQPYSEAITAGRRATSPAAAAAATARCSRRARDPQGRAHRDRGRPRSVRRVQLVGDPRRRARDAREHAARGRDYALVARRPQGRGLLPLPRLPHRRRVHAGSPTSPTYEDARPGRRGGRRARSSPATSTSCELVYTRFVSAGRQVVVRQTLDAARSRDEIAGDADRRRAAGRGGYEFEPSPEDDPRPAAAALRRGARLRRAAQRARRRSTRPASGR